MPKNGFNFRILGRIPHSSKPNLTKLHENIIYLNSDKSLLVKITVNAGLLMNKNEV